MRKVIDFFKDLLYDATDYALIITVVAIIAVVLIWRLSILFNLDISKEPIDPIDIPPIEEPDNVEEPSDVTPDNPPTENPTDEDPAQPDNIEVTINIPSGSYPSDIADILLSNELISDKEEFLDRAVKLELDTKLQSGEFIIKKGLSVDDILKIIARESWNEPLKRLI